MLALCQEWEQSGKNQKQFCDQYSLKLGTFGYWRRQYLEEQRHKGVDGFIPILSNEVQLSLKIQYPNGVIVNVPANTALDQIQSLVHLF